MRNEKFMKKKSLYWQIPFLLLLIAGTWFIAHQQRAASEPAGYQHDEGFVFGTVYSITYQSDTNLKDEVESALAEVDGEFSMFNEKSTVAAINRGEHPQRSKMFKEVYDLAQQVTADTDGAFDITVAPLVNAWGFGFKNEQMPTPEQVDSLLKIRSQMDFSAIAKGYGCDVVARMLEAHGIRNYMVEIGGEVVTRGHNPKDDLWKIGVTKPTDDSLSTENELQTVLAVGDVAMATRAIIASSIIKVDGNMLIPSTRAPVTPCSMKCSRPPFCPTAVLWPMPMPHRLWYWGWSRRRPCSVGILR